MLALLACALVAFAYTRSQSEPQWWSEQSAPTSAQQAESFEHALIAQLTRVRETGDPWSAALSESDLNAWLAHRLTPWLSNRGLTSPLPASATLRVRLHANQLLLGIRTPDALLWIAARPTIRDNRIHLDPLEAGVGNLAVPTWVLRSKLSADLNNWLAQGLPAAAPIDRARVARLQELTCQPHELLITVQTTPRP